MPPSLQFKQPSLKFGTKKEAARKVHSMGRMGRRLVKEDLGMEKCVYSAAASDPKCSRNEDGDNPDATQQAEGL
jgi:hypothetical protein